MTLMSRTQNKTISLSTGRRIKNFSLSYWHNTAGLNGLYKNVERYTRDRRPGRSSGQKAKNTIKYNKDKIPVRHTAAARAAVAAPRFVFTCE